MAKSKAQEVKEGILRQGSKVNRGTKFVSTGSTISDLVIGCGNGLGIETGSLINIAGKSGGGKSQLINSIIGCANRDYTDILKKRMLDSENGNCFSTEEIYGYSLDNAEIATCRTVEECHADINLFLADNKDENIGIYAVDSIDGLLGAETDESIEERTVAYSRGKEYDQKTYGAGKPKYLSQYMLPDLANKLLNKNSILAITSQVRDNINAGLYGPKDIIANGRALLFYSHIQLWLKKKKAIEENGVEIGAVVEYTIKKGRGPRSFGTCLVTIYYTMGIDGIATDVDYLFDLRSTTTGELLGKANKEIIWRDTTFNNRDELINHIDNNDLLDELKEDVINKWNSAYEAAMKPIEGRKNRYKV